MTILTLRNVSKVFDSPDNGLDQVAAFNTIQHNEFNYHDP